MFTGSIPDSIGKLSKLGWIFIELNKMSGVSNDPTFACNCSNAFEHSSRMHEANKLLALAAVAVFIVCVIIPASKDN